MSDFGAVVQHVYQFTTHGLCTPEGGKAWFGTQGQYREIKAKGVNCPTCLLLFDIIEANRVEYLFDSDMRKLAAYLRSFLK